MAAAFLLAAEGVVEGLAAAEEEAAGVPEETGLGATGAEEAAGAAEEAAGAAEEAAPEEAAGATVINVQLIHLILQTRTYLAKKN